MVKEDNSGRRKSYLYENNLMEKSNIQSFGRWCMDHVCKNYRLSVLGNKIIKQRQERQRQVRQPAVLSYPPYYTSDPTQPFRLSIKLIDITLTMLDVTARGILEKAIDEVKGVIPELVRDKDTFGTQTSQTYFMGFARGYIYGKFSTLFLLTNGRLPNYGETKEMDEVMNNRLAELRGAVSKAGAEPES